MYKACIFDLDGTLTDTLESLTVSVNLTLEQLGLNHITAQQCRSFVGDGARCLIERALKASGDTELSKIEQGMELYGSIFATYCMYHVEPYEGVREMLEYLKTHGIAAAVLSNKPHEQAVKVVEEIFGKDTFAIIQGQKDDVPKKPDPTAVYQILELLHAKPEEGIYAGDSDVDVKTGKAAGMFTVGVTWGFRSKELLVATGADATIDQAYELLEFL